MTDLDETLLTAAKLREQAQGRLDGDSDLLAHTGLVRDSADRSTLSFVESSGIDLGSLGDVVASTLKTREASEALAEGDSNTVSAYVGVTEQDLEASNLTLPIRLLDRMDNHDAPAFVTAVGNPNTGKTNTAVLLARLRDLDLDNLLILSNVREWSMVDHVVTSMHDLAVTVLEHRDTPKWILLDEGSTHFDARTYRREIAMQYTPLAKRYAKLDVDTECVIGHTGKDLHPERKALTTTAFFKSSPKSAEFFDSWDRDAAHPTDRLFGGDLNDLEKAHGYDPDDAAPWSWNLEPEIFSLDLSWGERLDELCSRGPSES